MGDARKENNSISPFFLRLITWGIPEDFSLLNDSKKYVFILSSGRTGTKFFGEFLNNFDRVHAAHEPRPSYRLRMWSHAFLENSVDKETMKNVLYSQRKNIISDNFDVYIESNPFITGFTEFLGDVFKDPTVIHIVRDPRDYVKSSLNHGTSTGLKFFLNKHLPYWFANVEKILDKDRDLEMPLRVAGFWAIVNEHIEKRAEKYTYHLYKFEDLFSNNEEYLRDLSSKIGISPYLKESFDMKTSKVNESHLKVLGSWYDWSDEFCAEIDSLCGKAMQKYGYGQEEEWKKKVEDGYKQGIKLC